MLILSAFWLGHERSGLLGQCSLQLWKLGIYYALTFFVGEIVGWEASLGTELHHLGRGLLWIKWNCFSYPLWCIYFQTFFAPVGFWELTTGLPRSNKGILIPKCLLKSVFLWVGKEGWKKSYSTVLLMSLSILLIKSYSCLLTDIEDHVCGDGKNSMIIITYWILPICQALC